MLGLIRTYCAHKLHPGTLTYSTSTALFNSISS